MRDQGALDRALYIRVAPKLIDPSAGGVSTGSGQRESERQHSLEGFSHTKPLVV